jgi:hypothetical protein
MPAKDTICIDLGNWIIAFYVVYVISGIAVLSAIAVLADQLLRVVRRRRLIKKERLTLALGQPA